MSERHNPYESPSAELSTEEGAQVDDVQRRVPLTFKIFGGLYCVFGALAALNLGYMLLIGAIVVLIGLGLFNGHKWAFWLIVLGCCASTLRMLVALGQGEQYEALRMLAKIAVGQLPIIIAGIRSWDQLT